MGMQKMLKRINENEYFKIVISAIAKLSFNKL